MVVQRAIEAGIPTILIALPPVVRQNITQRAVAPTCTNGSKRWRPNNVEQQTQILEATLRATS